MPDGAWDALSLQANIDAYFNAIPMTRGRAGIGGHDMKRIASKLGQAQVKHLAMLCSR